MHAGGENMQYPKINSAFKRDEKGKMLFGEYSSIEFIALKDAQWSAAEKIDGTNIRLFKDGTFRGRTDRATFNPEQEVVLLKWAQKFKEANLPDGAVMYGELYGKDIQAAGRDYSDEYEFCAFDIWLGNRWFDMGELHAFCDPVFPAAHGRGCMSLDDWTVCFVKGYYKKSYHTHSACAVKDVCEGVVLRPLCTLLDAQGNRIITKLKHKDFKDL
jgi:hypothetical protein